MGGGASSLNRIRKAIVIRAYNLRRPDESLDDQFRRFATRDADGSLRISVVNIKSCLMMETNEYEWVDAFFHHAFNEQASTLLYADFIRFLESGRPPAIPATPVVEKSASQPVLSTAPGRSATPPLPPHRGTSSSNNTSTPDPALQVHPPMLTSSGSYRSIADAASIKIEHLGGRGGGGGSRVQGRQQAETSRDSRDRASAAAGDALEGADDLEDSVMHINLSSAVANPHSLPESVKLHTTDHHAVSRSGEEDAEGKEEQYTVILHPSRSAQQLGPAVPLWRKVETVRQERTVHYTTIDANGEQQELIERETTQSEVLHMECKETGEFAHRETTQFEQMETFNEEVVAQTKGAEEYVHLKSRDDEYHHMESTMPNKGDQGEGQGEGEGGGQGGDGGAPHMEGGAAASAEEQAALEEEYQEAYRLYEQKQREGQQGPEQPHGEEEGEGDGEGYFNGSAARGSSRFRAPSLSPHPPPFSDESAQGVAYGFGGGAEGDERRRAEDAFAFAEEMEHFAQSPPQHQHQQAPFADSPQALFGERVEVVDEAEDEGVRGQGLGAAVRAEEEEARRRASRERLFAPADPPEEGHLTRSSSYESLHEID